MKRQRLAEEVAASYTDNMEMNTKTCLKGDNTGCNNIRKKETTDVKVIKQLVETFLSTIARRQHHAVQYIDMKHLTSAVKDMKMELLTESEQYNCVGVVYKKKAPNCKKNASTTATTDYNCFQESKRIDECSNKNQASIKPCHSNCKCNCDCDYLQCRRRERDMKMYEDVPPEPKKRKWQSIFGLFGR